MTVTVQRRKIEILVDRPLLPRVSEAAASAAVTGYTLLPAAAGAGHAGAWSEDELTGAQSKVMFVTVTTAEKAEALIEALAPLLDRYGLMLMSSTVDVVRAGKY